MHVLMQALGEHNALVWDEGEACTFIKSLSLTKPEILEACADLKLLGKGDFRKLLQWRLKVADEWRRHQLSDRGAVEDEAKRAGGARGDEDEARDHEIEELQRKAAARLKSAKRKEAEKRAKIKERLALKMEHPGDRLDVSEEIELFALSRIKSMASPP
jgi:AdoMet-dependent rRNA methyltransferase SPB1